MEVRFRLLGQLDVASDSGRQVVGRPRERLLLGILCLNAGRPVSVDHILDTMWPEDPPNGGRKALQTLVSRLRSAFMNADLGEYAASLATHQLAYEMRIDPLEVDAHVFRSLVDRARCADSGTAAVLLRQAVALCRGPVLGGLLPDSSHHLQHCWEDARVSALEDLYEAEIENGRHVRVTDEVREVVGQHPLRERLVRSLMLVNYRCGRLAEALQTYHTYRVRLADELGVDPRPELQGLYGQMLDSGSVLNVGQPGRTAPV